MRQLERGMFARSLAGHDKGRLYIVLDCTAEGVLLADGIHFTLDRPKKKKRIHLQPDFHMDPELKDKIENKRPVTDREIQKAISMKEEKPRCQRQM